MKALIRIFVLPLPITFLYYLMQRPIAPSHIVAAYVGGAIAQTIWWLAWARK